MPAPKVLVVATSHDQMGSTGHRTGVWLEELAAPYYTLLDGGAEVTLVSIKGGPIPWDPRSLPAEDKGALRGDEDRQRRVCLPSGCRCAMSS
jgi:putative intracellular protease/amidase